MPRVVHLVIDGFDPELAIKNEDTGFKVFDPLDPTLLFFDKVLEHSRKWSIVNYIPSNFSWFRIYSGKEYNCCKNLRNPYSDENYNENAAHYTEYENVNPDNFLWNKLGSLGVRNYWFPYFKVTEMLNRKYKDIVKHDNVFIHAVNYRSSECTLIENQKRYRLKEYPDYTDFYDKNELGQKNKELISIWKSGKLDEFENFYDNNLIPGLISACEKNLIMYELFMNKVKNLSNINNYNNYKDLEFIHISSIELDAFYHYSIPSDSMHDLMRSFYSALLLKVKEILNPAILVITGDHGFRFFNKNDSHLNEYYGRPVKYKCDFDTKYGLIPSTKAIFNDFPFSRTHNNSQGYVIYINNDSDININFHPYVSKYSIIPASDDLYNLFCDKDFWMNIKCK